MDRRALPRAAFVGDGDDPDVSDLALLAHRVAQTCAAARRAQDGPSAPAP